MSHYVDLGDGWLAEEMDQVPDLEVKLKFKKREDGGLRIWSDDIPGLVLSGKDPDAVIRDLGVALPELFLFFRRMAMV